MLYRVYYFLERAQEQVSSVGPMEMSAREARELLHRLSGENDYLGLIDAEENILQISREPGGDRYWVELPVEAAKASYGRHMGIEELEALLRAQPGVFDQETIPDLSYRPW